MKRVVLLSASPRKNGNSDILCHQFIKGAEDAGHDCELITLYDKKINFCRACYACFKSGKCILNDDMADILDKVQEAEVLVIATPTYFLTMNGMLKATIDRFLPKWQELGGHDVYLIITGHDSKAGLKLVGDELTDIFQLSEMRSRGSSGVRMSGRRGKSKPQKLWKKPIMPDSIYKPIKLGLIIHSI